MRVKHSSDEEKIFEADAFPSELAGPSPLYSKKIHYARYSNFMLYFSLSMFISPFMYC